MTRIIDISWPLFEGVKEYEDNKSLKFDWHKTMKDGQINQSKISLDSHTGTHIDAPLHMTENGLSVDKISLYSVVGNAIVLDLTYKREKITLGDLKKEEIEPGAIVLFKTQNSYQSVNSSFNPNFVYLDSSAAKFLAHKKVRAVGIDSLSLGSHDAHQELSVKSIPVIEGLRLKHVVQGQYFLVCLPIKVRGLEAAPARAILFDRRNF